MRSRAEGVKTVVTKGWRAAPGIGRQRDGRGLGAAVRGGRLCFHAFSPDGQVVSVCLQRREQSEDLAGRG